eukprot:6190469-Pleurochrysis_carterae.AAC.2
MEPALQIPATCSDRERGVGSAREGNDKGSLSAQAKSQDHAPQCSSMVCTCEGCGQILVRACVRACACVRVCVRVRARACVRACACVCVRGCVGAWVRARVRACGAVPCGACDRLRTRACACKRLPAGMLSGHASAAAASTPHSRSPALPMTELRAPSRAELGPRTEPPCIARIVKFVSLASEPQRAQA